MTIAAADFEVAAAFEEVVEEVLAGLVERVYLGEACDVVVEADVGIETVITPAEDLSNISASRLIHKELESLLYHSP